MRDREKRLFIILFSVIGFTSSTSAFTIEEAEDGEVGLRVTVRGGDGEVCVRSGSESAGCEFANGETLEFELGPGAVGVGGSFRTCDDNAYKTGRNGEEKAPEHIYLGGGSDGGYIPDEEGDEDEYWEGDAAEEDYPGPSNNRYYEGLDWSGVCNNPPLSY